jgi:hypothetical protein
MDLITNTNEFHVIRTNELKLTATETDKSSRVLFRRYKFLFPNEVE